MEQAVLNEIIKKHSYWLKGLECGKRADLSGADLRRADLSEANLSRADLRGANIYGADLRGANIYGADLSGADLRGADLRGVNLSGANLSESDLYGADLYGANIRGANLEYIDLSKAKNVPFIPMTCPESGSFIGWKKAGDKIIKLEILEDSRRSSSTGRKCRCDKAKVLAIENIDGTDSGLKEICSDYDSSFVYKIGEIVEEPNFCTDRFIECAPGIHFFINRVEAIEYV